MNVRVANISIAVKEPKWRWSSPLFNALLYALLCKKAIFIRLNLWKRHASSCNFFFVVDIQNVLGHETLLDLALELRPMMLVGSFVNEVWDV